MKFNLYGFNEVNRFYFCDRLLPGLIIQCFVFLGNPYSFVGSVPLHSHALQNIDITINRGYPPPPFAPPLDNSNTQISFFLLAQNLQTTVRQTRPEYSFVVMVFRPCLSECGVEFRSVLHKNMYEDMDRQLSGLLCKKNHYPIELCIVVGYHLFYS